MKTSTIAALAPELAAGRIRAERLAEDALSTITSLQPSLNAFITVMTESALESARAADREIAAGGYRGPLHGVPISIKDLVDIAGLPTTAASRLRAEHIATRDAPVIAHLKDAGAVIVGKTNLHEFAFGTTSEDSGWGPARHPLDPARSPGGSSGGSAAAVRSGMSVASVGTDTGGSIRIPAAACGVVGLKPSWGEISAHGVVPLSRQLDHVGPLTNSVADAAVMYDVLRGLRPRVVDRRDSGVATFAFATLDGYFRERIAPEVETAIDAVYDTLRQAGATMSSRTLAHAADIAPIYLHLVLADAAAYHATALQQRPHGYTENVRLRLEMGRYVLAEDYVRALQGRRVIAREVERALAGVDALLLPALAVEAPPIGANAVPVKGGSEPVRNIMLRCTQPFNLSGHPAISLPCGTLKSGMPVGLQIVGHQGRTDDLLHVARAVERALNSRG
jgi:aspartyl-tRNA(Asn)/glutamyl-tRNA(Gln) amidotransferase subunit A